MSQRGLVWFGWVKNEKVTQRRGRTKDDTEGDIAGAVSGLRGVGQGCI